MQKSTIITLSLIFLVIAGILFFSPDDKQAAIPSTEMDSFAQCIADSNATLYGAWWCPHCEEQREMFGTSEQFLPYQECSLPNSKSQNLVCKKAGIQVYPTWIFSDGSKVEGSLPFDAIAEKTNCPLPTELALDTPPALTATSTTDEGTLTEETEDATSTEDAAVSQEEATSTEEIAS